VDPHVPHHIRCTCGRLSLGCHIQENGELGYHLSSRARIVQDVFNLLDAKVSDTDYFFTSRLPGEPVDGVNDVHTHPVLPRSARVGLRLSF
jgi:hypothetical protein